jgi:aerobic-type carbon monoxide dehydrogenase small subunit (CoxS/CutS family)
MSTLTLMVNGMDVALEAAPDASLLSVLREQLGLTGAKICCAEGACGACTVLVDGVVVRACVTPATAAAERVVHTIEGLAAGGALHPLQSAFLETGAFQCGYCTPGMIMAAVGLLRHNPNPDRAAIIDALNGNICRCGIYHRIVRAVEQAATELRADERGAP